MVSWSLVTRLGPKTRLNASVELNRKPSGSQYNSLFHLTLPHFKMYFKWTTRAFRKEVLLVHLCPCTIFFILRLPFFKACVVSAIFHRWYPFKNYEKRFLFHLKSSFRFRDIHIFVFSSSPYFLLVSHCFRGWSNINLLIWYYQLSK